VPGQNGGLFDRKAVAAFHSHDVKGRSCGRHVFFA
jgi:hypothetical protein